MPHHHKSCFIIGEGTLPVQCADILLQANVDIYGVISSDSALLQWAADNNIPSCSPKDIVPFLKQRSFDYLFSIVNPHILPVEILTLPRQYAINYHDAPLPKYAGVYATSWAILNGEKTHGVTWHLMAGQVDAGDILAQQLIDIASNDTALTLNTKCYEAAVDTFSTLVENLATQQVTPIKQNLNDRTYFSFYRRPPAGGVVSWQQSGHSINALVRALTFGDYANYLGLPKFAIGDQYFAFSGAQILAAKSESPPGTVVDIQPDSLIVATADYDVALKGLSTLEGQSLNFAAFTVQFKLNPGNILQNLSADTATHLADINSQVCRHESFWVERLARLQPITLPYETPSQASPQFTTCDWPLPPDIDNLSNDFLTAAFVAYLARLNDTDTFDVGFKSSVAEFDTFFAPYIPLSIEIDPETSFANVKQVVRQEIALTTRHQTYARDVVARYPELKQMPVLTTLIAWVEDAAQYQPPTDAVLAFVISDGGQVVWVYNAQVLSHDAVTVMMAQFTTFVRNLAAQPKQPLYNVSLLTDAERQQILVTWNDTQADYPQQPFPYLFQQQAARTPTEIAVVYEDEVLTYQELDQRSNQLAHYLQSVGVGVETLVAVCLERSLDMMVGLLGILKAGGAYVPLDPLYPAERLAVMLQDSGAPVIITQSTLLEQLTPGTARVICLDTEAQAINQQPTENLDHHVTLDNLAYVIYTSGSTGTPKGVAIEHRGLTNYLCWASEAYEVAKGQGTPVHSSISFDLTITGLFLPLLAGRTVTLLPESRGSESLGEILRAQNDFSLIKITPAHLEALSQMLLPQDVAGKTHRLIIGGEALRQEPLTFWQQNAPHTHLVNEYGPTEAVVGCCIYQIPPGHTISGDIPIGRPIANTQLYMLDKHLQPVPVGVAGELYVGGHGVARGYLNQPELTREKFIPNPFLRDKKESSRLYKTGDLARYQPNGTLEFLGRLDQQVKIRGYRIELGEIETVLQAHPAVHDAVAVVSQDVAANKLLAVYAVADSLAVVEDLENELELFLQAKLPHYMLPSKIIFINALPLTRNGKVDYKALPAIDFAQNNFTQTYVAPRNFTEQQVNKIWTSVLGVAQIGVLDSFFKLGGHSLLALQMLSRVRDAFQVDIPLRALYESPTIAGLAQHIELLLRQPVPSGAQIDVSPITLASRDKPPPLSFGQQSLWFLQQLQPDNIAYNIPLKTHLSGPLNIDVLEESLRQIIRRHENLRTTFDIVGEQPVQMIQLEVDFQLPVVTATPDEVEQWMAEDARRPFDLAQGPLLRVRLFCVMPESHILYFNFHHIIFDGWSMDCFSRELTALYRQQTAAPDSAALPDIAIQYADFSAWEKARFESAGAEGLAYWQEKLGDNLPALQLPTDFSPDAGPRFKGRTYNFMLPLSLTESLKDLSRAQHVTLFITLLAAFKLLLYRYSNQDDILVGVPSANRVRHELENLIGFFVNTLVFRTDLSGSPTFMELLNRVKTITLEAQAHQDTPFSQLVTDLHPDRDLSRQPLFEAMFILQPPSGEFGALLDLPEVVATPLQMIENGTTKFDLSLEMFESEQGLAGFFEYSTDLFAEDTIARMVGHFQMLLEGIAANPDQIIDTLPLLTDVERHQILVTWNQTTVDYPLDKCLHHFFEAQAVRTPHNLAVTFPGLDFDLRENQQLTYQALNEEANQLAHHLQKLGVGPEKRVGIYMSRSLDMVVALLGVLKAGGAYVPLNPDYPQERLAFMLNDIQATVLLTHASLVDELPESVTPIICLDTDWPTIAQEKTENPVSAVTANNLAYIIYTSGSTGRPKGTMITHKSVSNHMLWNRDAFPLDETDAVLQSSSFSFDASVCEFFMPWFVGARLVMAQPDGHKDSHYLVKLIMAHDISVILIVPALLGLLLEEPDFAKCQSLKFVFPGGEALPVAFIKRFYQQFSIDLYNTYGPTEVTIDSTWWLCDRDLARNAVAIGRPISNYQAYILDAHLQPVPVGVSGELHIGGVGLSRGYLNRPGLTAEKFIPHPFDNHPEARLYKTGDLARYWPDGNIEYMGRIDQQIKLRGFRIELGEIESLLNRHQAIQQAVVILREDADDLPRLVAYVIFGNDEPLSAQVLRNYLSPFLPDYMIPAAFVPLDVFPVATSGKIDMRALPAPQISEPELQQNYVAPNTAVEKLLANIWAEILGVKKIGVHDDFFELGGHSLLVAQVILRVRQMFQIDLPVAKFFDAPTVAELAKTIHAIRNRANVVGHEIDLKAEVVLDADIQAKFPVVTTAAPTAIFLTGTTGFLGAFILADLLQQTQADIYCLVRAEDEARAYTRIQENLEECQVWNPDVAPRIKPVVGDLVQPRFGLSTLEFEELARRVDVIYHGAAYTNLVYPYQKLKPINVLGLKEILRLAVQEKTIPVHYISTLAVFSALNYFDGRTVYETDELQYEDALFNGYCRSKWVAEQTIAAARARGIPITVYRPGSIVGHSITGAWKTGDYLSRLVKGCLQLGSIPIANGSWHLTPVDYVSKAIVYLSQQPTLEQNTFHLNTPHLLSTAEFCNLIQGLGYTLQLSSYAHWQTELITLSRRNFDHALYALLPVFLESISSQDPSTLIEMYTVDKEPHYDDKNVRKVLAGTDIVCPPVDQVLLSTYFSYWIDRGFLTPPPTNI